MVDRSEIGSPICKDHEGWADLRNYANRPTILLVPYEYDLCIGIPIHGRMGRRLTDGALLSK